MNQNNHLKPKKPELNLSVKVRSTLTWLILGSTMPFYTLIAFVIVFLPLKLRHNILTSWCSLFLFLTKHICKTNYQVFGLENIIKEKSIFASNHQSTWETLAFNSILPQHVWIAKQELLKIPFFGWAFRTVSPIAIDRKNPAVASKQIISQGTKRINDGFWILVYPEGTRVATNVKNQPYKTGTARMALQLNLPITPIAHNAGYVMPRNSFWIYPGLVTIIIGKPIYIVEGDNIESLTLKIKTNITQELDKIN